MSRRLVRTLVLAGLTAAFIALPVSLASADIVTPAGACSGSATFASTGVTHTSAEYNPTDVVIVPQSDTVDWTGKIGDHALGDVGARRDINGAVQLDLPLGSATIDSWGGSSVRYANKGQHTYDFPSELIGVKMELTGYHEDNGVRTCSGSVFVEIAGSATKNPLLWGAVAGLVLFGGLLLYAGRPVFQKVYAFEDENPG